MNERSSMELNDEILCAYIDGELDQETRGRVEESLATDGAARARLERMQTADVSLKNAFPLATAPANDPLADYITREPNAVRHRSRFARRSTVMWGALAAGIGGIVVGYTLSNTASHVDGVSLASTSNEALSTALETQVSGWVVKGDSASIEVQLTFRAGDGRYCRVFRIASEREGTEGIACRNGGRWQVLALDATSGGRGDFRAAGASQLIDRAMDRLGGSASLEPKEERRAIDNHWPLNSQSAQRP